MEITWQFSHKNTQIKLLKSNCQAWSCWLTPFINIPLMYVLNLGIIFFKKSLKVGPETVQSFTFLEIFSDTFWRSFWPMQLSPLPQKGLSYRHFAEWIPWCVWRPGSQPFERQGPLNLKCYLKYRQRPIFFILN